MSLANAPPRRRRPAWNETLPSRWQRCQRAIIGRRQFWCRLWHRVVHHPRLAAASLVLASAQPQAGAFLAARISGVGPQVPSHGVTL